MRLGSASAPATIAVIDGITIAAPHVEAGDVSEILG